VTKVKVESFRAIARILLNGQKYQLVGQGSVDEDKGIVEGRYEHNIPANDIDPYVFQTVLVTGYPSVCRPNGFSNPFSGVDYSYRREIDFGRHGWMAYTAKCYAPTGRDCKQLDSEFDVEGELTLPELKGASPLIEEWRPQGPGEIASSFEIAWPHRSGRGQVRGEARTIYRPPAGAAISAPRRRHIVFRRVFAADTILEITQESWLAPESAS
jgi:hypothetical protein